MEGASLENASGEGVPVKGASTADAPGAVPQCPVLQ